MAQSSWFNRISSGRLRVAKPPSATQARSLTRDTLLPMSGLIAAVVLCSTTASYFHLRLTLETGVKDQLEKYVTERGQRENLLFKQAADNHKLLREELRRQLGNQDSQKVQQQFSQLVKPWPDGTLRNAPPDQPIEDFNTQSTATVFLGQNIKLTDDLKDRLVVFNGLANTYGPAWRNQFMALYFTLPENAITVYFPPSPWGLELASTMQLPQEDWFSIASAQRNPGRKTVWTSVFQDPISQTWFVTASTPVYDAQNRHLVTIGHDLALQELFDRTTQNHLKGTYNLILRADGKLIVHPRLMQQIQDAKGNFDVTTMGDDNLRRIFQQVSSARTDLRTGVAVLENAVDQEFLAIAKLPDPDWYFITVYPKSLLNSQALSNAGIILGLGSLALLVEISLLAYVFYHKISVPLKGLLTATEQVTSGNFDVRLPVERQDELGRLAQSFTSMAHQLRNSFSNLEQKIAERTTELISAKAETEKINAELEQRVTERTAEVQAAMDELGRSQLQLVQSEKMSALGQLVAGVAHEINNPVGFIQGNLTYAEEYLAQLIEHLQLYQTQAPPAAIEAHAEDIDLEYLLSDLPNLLTSMTQGTSRIREISNSLRIFSRSDTVHPVEFSLNENLESTLLILKHRLKAEDGRSAIQVTWDYGKLPRMTGYPGQLNQVFMNLLANAIDAFPLGHKNPQIHVQTQVMGEQVEIQIQDNGVGIPEEIQQRMFDYLFTTKEVGKGTGIGLAIAQQIVVEKHGGAIAVKSQPGEGATFILTLPIQVKST
jgi:two-component system, NtrC family, sensor kinase